MANDMGFSRWRLIFGPWPFVPLPIFVFGVMGFTGRGIVVAGVSSDSTLDIVLYTGELILQGAVIMVAVVAVMIVVGGWRRGEHAMPTRTRYLITCFVGSALASAGLLSLRFVNEDAVTGKGLYANFWVAAASTVLTMVILLVAISNGAGYARFRIREQTDRLLEQVDQLGRQRTLIIEADERVRNEVATALHDEVQGVLLRANLRLSAIAESVAPAEAEGLRTVVADLEELRGAGIRSVGRRIAPPIETVGLVAALDGLAGSYTGSIDVTIRVAEGLDAGERAPAVYRIVEQALLNAALHGRAAHVVVVVEQVDGRLTVIVEDDGVGPSAEPMPGTGTAIIDAWVGSFAGEWSLASRPGGGARLTASVSI
jgi:signal transduction histidine kinase